MMRFWLWIYEWVDKIDSFLVAPAKDKAIKGAVYTAPLKRIGAGIIDLVCIVAVYTVTTTIGLKFIKSPETQMGIAILCFYFIPTIYFLLLRHRSVGKWALDLKVISIQTGNAAEWGQLLLREVAKVISAPICPFMFIASLFSKKARWPHDFIASTAIIKETKGN